MLQLSLFDFSFRHCFFFSLIEIKTSKFERSLFSIGYLSEEYKWVNFLFFQKVWNSNEKEND